MAILDKMSIKVCHKKWAPIEGKARCKCSSAHILRPDFSVYVPNVRILAERQDSRKAVLYVGMAGMVVGGLEVPIISVGY